MSTSGVERSEKIERSSGNVFADLGFADAGERQTKVRLAMAINDALHRRGLSQEKAAKLLGINQPKVSALSKYRLEGFSVERLMRFLTSLSQDVEIIIRNRPRARRPGRVIVTADSTSPRHSSGRSGSLPRRAGPSSDAGALRPHVAVR